MANRPVVNIQQNDNRAVALPGYVIKLDGDGPAPEPKVVEHQTETPIVPAKSENGGDAQQRDLAKEKAELAAPRPSRG